VSQPNLHFFHEFPLASNTSRRGSCTDRQ